MDKSMIKGLAVGGLAMVLVGAGAVTSYKTLASPREAQVVAVKPVTETVVTPRERCTDVQLSERAPVQDEKRVAGTVIGALAGAALGNQVGGGSGKKLATVAGAAAGGYAGNQVQKNMQQKDVVTRTERRCEMVDERSERTIAYDVTYRLDGQQATARSTRKPGATVQVKGGEIVEPAPRQDT